MACSSPGGGKEPDMAEQLNSKQPLDLYLLNNRNGFNILLLKRLNSVHRNEYKGGDIMQNFLWLFLQNIPHIMNHVCLHLCLG